MTAPRGPCCRICGGARTALAGRVEYFSGYGFDVVDCADCGCRHTRHDPAVYEFLHRYGALDYYAGYRETGDAAQRLYAVRDVAGLRRLLAANTKYLFVMDEIDRLAPGSRVLEIGCSRGYVTAYALAAGMRAVGVDASDAALETARAAFGDVFFAPGLGEIRARGPYDLIFHVGLIGCVADPIALTHELLGLLAPSGRLIFNAPNLGARESDDQLWFDSAPPPDLVTIFPEGFWSERFTHAARVMEGVESRSQRAAFEIELRRRLGARWRPPSARPLEGGRRATPATGTRLAVRAQSAVSRLAELAGIARLAPSRPTEFGLFVKMRPLGGPA